MKRLLCSAALCALFIFPYHLVAQSLAASRSPKAEHITRLIKYAGSTKRAAAAGTVAVNFAIYSDATGEAPLWQETQNVQLDEQGRYTALLGSSRELPMEIFSANSARWLGVQVLADSEPEQARVLLVSVPYALKAQDAETLGGRPASDYLLAAAAAGGSSSPKVSGRGGQAAGVNPEGPVQTITSTTLNAIPKFSGTDTLADSLMFEQYNQVATDAFGQSIAGNEDVVRIGDGTGLRKRLQVAGRLVTEGFDINTNLVNSVRIVNTNANGSAMQLNNLSDSANFTRGIYASAQSGNAIGIQGFVFPPLVPSVPGTDYTYAMLGMNLNPEGVALMGWQGYDGVGGFSFPAISGPVGIYGSVNHTSGIAAILDHRAAGGGKILSARSQGVEKIAMTTAGNITATGSVTAASFSGDGSGLTNVSGAGVLASNPAPCASNKFVTDIDADGTLNCTQPSSADLSDVATLATKTYADAGDTSLAAPGYITVTSSATLASERVLTGGNGITVTDGGAGTTVTIGNKADFVQTSVEAGDTISSVPSGGSTFVTTYTIPANTITAGTVIEVWASGVQITDVSGGFFSYGIDLNSTAVLTIAGGGGLFQNASINGYWNLQARLVCISVAGSTATFESSGVNLNTKGTEFGSRNLITGATVDPTIAQVLKVRELVATGGVNSATMRQLIVKILK